MGLCELDERLPCIFGINAGELYYMRQHDRQFVSVNVFLWGPYQNMRCCLRSLEPEERRAGQTDAVAFGIIPHRSWLFWLRSVFHLAGVDHSPSASHHGQLANRTALINAAVYACISNIT